MKLGWWRQNVSPSNSSSWFSGRWPVKEVSLSWYGTHFLLVATVTQGSFSSPVLTAIKSPQQMCGNFEGFPLKKSALFGFWLELQKTIKTPRKSPWSPAEEWQAYQAKFNSAQDAGWTGDQVKAGKNSWRKMARTPPIFIESKGFWTCIFFPLIWLISRFMRFSDVRWNSRIHCGLQPLHFLKIACKDWWYRRFVPGDFSGFYVRPSPPLGRC